MAPLAPGPLSVISHGALRVTIAAQAGGRIAQIEHGGVRSPESATARQPAAMIAWGCYPMVPWAGRIRRGRFEFGGREYQLPLNLDPHAIHGLGFAMPWSVSRHETSIAELTLRVARGRALAIWRVCAAAHRCRARPPRAHIVGTCGSGSHACRYWLASVVSQTGASRLFSKPHVPSRRGGDSDPAIGGSVTGTVGRPASSIKIRSKCKLQASAYA
jgi:hypothetical protein